MITFKSPSLGTSTPLQKLSVPKRTLRRVVWIARAISHRARR